MDALEEKTWLMLNAAIYSYSYTPIQFQMYFFTHVLHIVEFFAPPPPPPIHLLENTHPSEQNRNV